MNVEGETVQEEHFDNDHPDHNAEEDEGEKT